MTDYYIKARSRSPHESTKTQQQKLPMRKILLVDFAFIGQDGGGHSEAYLMKLLSVLTSNDYYVYLCSGANHKLNENIEKQKLENCQTLDLSLNILDKIVRHFLLAIDAFLHRIDKLPYCKFSSLINLIYLKRIIWNLGEDIPIFFAYTDAILPEVPTFISKLFMPKKWIGLHICPSYQSKLQFGIHKSRHLFNSEKNFSLPSCKSVLVLHPTYQKFLSKRFNHINCFRLPELLDIEELTTNKDDDITEQVNFDLLSQIREKAQGRKIISMLGNITFRKNIPLLLDAVSKLDPSRCFVVILGRLRDRDNPQCQTHIDKINFYRNQLSDNSFVDVNYYIANEREFYELVKISDIMFLYYTNHPFSSNVLVKSMGLRKPVIVSKGYLMEKTVNQYDWEASVEPDANKVAQAIEMLISSDFEIAEKKYQSFVNDFSPESFEKAVLQACESLRD